MPIRRLVLTSGEPAGIGPDLCIQLAQQALPVEIIVIADSELLLSRAKQLSLPLRLENFDPLTNQKAKQKPKQKAEPKPQEAGTLTVLNVPLNEPVVAGKLSTGNAKYVLQTLDTAIEGCLSKTFDAIVTGPVHKGIINQAGIKFTGHTEYLADRCGGMLPVMMLATAGLRVALVTTHLPLSKVSESITVDRLGQVVEILHEELVNRFGIKSPNILVCGLNPHAGEGGHLGREEIEIIIPVLNQFRERGWNIQGPLPADTLFVPEKIKHADAVLAMYHDQGLPVLKHMGFGQAVNITLGLPIIRTSVDHGVALDLAGTGKAKADSLVFAVNIATELANKAAEHRA